MNNKVMKCRSVKINKNGDVYLHRDDIMQILLELGATESTDTQYRINALLKNLLQMKPYVEQET